MALCLRVQFFFGQPCIFESILNIDEITNTYFDHQFDAFVSVYQKPIDKYAQLKDFS